eukprot:1409082-Amphidinium_carterae.1
MKRNVACCFGCASVWRVASEKLWRIVFVEINCAKADPHSTDRLGRNALHLAVAEGPFTCDINCLSCQTRILGTTCLSSKIILSCLASAWLWPTFCLGCTLGRHSMDGECRPLHDIKGTAAASVSSCNLEGRG